MFDHVKVDPDAVTQVEMIHSVMIGMEDALLAFRETNEQIGLVALEDYRQLVLTKLPFTFQGRTAHAIQNVTSKKELVDLLFKAAKDL